MFGSGSLDRLTLACIRKSMQGEALEKAESQGLFDLLKASNLHPEKVLVHGKHGDYYAFRNKKGAEGSLGETGAGRTVNPMKKLAKWEQKHSARKQSAKPKPAPGPEPKPKPEPGPKVKPSPKPEPKPKPSTKPKVKPSVKPKPKPVSQSVPEMDSAGKTAREASDFLQKRYRAWAKEQGGFRASYVRNDPYAHTLALMQFYDELAENFGYDLAQKALTMDPVFNIRGALEWASNRPDMVYVKDSGLLLTVNSSFRAKAVHTYMSRALGSLADDELIRAYSRYSDQTERQIQNTRARYASDEAMVRDNVNAYIAREVTRVMRGQYGDNYEHAPKSKDLQAARVICFLVLKGIFEGHEDIVSEDYLYSVTKAYRPYVDTSPHRAEGTVPKGSPHDSAVLGVSLMDGDEEMTDAAASVNPHRGDPKYANNCQSCVVAYEARRRGFDATAAPRIITHAFDQAFEGAKVINIAPRYPDERREAVEKQMAAWGDGARAIVCVWWDRASYGHVFVAEQRDGRTHFLEPQDPKSDPDRIANYFYTSHDVGLMRCDNLPFTGYARERVEQEV